MSNETLPSNPLEDSPGLSDEQHDKASELLARQSRGEQYLALHEVPDLPYRPLKQELHEMLGLHNVDKAINAVVLRGVKRAENARTKHYKKNEGAYQEQAVKDAAAEGIHTTFGADEDSDIKKAA